MIWNYAYNRPLGNVIDLTINPSEFKSEVEDWLEESKENGFFDTGLDEIKYCEDLEQNIKDSLECVKYDLNQYMLSHAYLSIRDSSLRNYFIVHYCLSNSPSSEMIEFDSDYYPETGVNICAKSDDMRWGGAKTVSDSDIYCRLYFCESENDIWDIFADGVGDVKSLYFYYMRNHESDKAFTALLYIYNYEDKFLKAVGGRVHKTCHESVRKDVESILIDYYFDGMDDGFFDENNIERVQEAWNTGILEVRKEFLKTEHSLKILKGILNNLEF